MLERCVDWPQRLAKVCDLWKDTPHDWNGADCATFAADCVLAMTGVDLIEAERGRYSTAIGAARVIKSSGYDCLEDMIAARTAPCAPTQCRRGDIVLCDGEAGEFIGVVFGHYAVAPSTDGLIQVNLKFAKRGFRI